MFVCMKSYYCIISLFHYHWCICIIIGNENQEGNYQEGFQKDFSTEFEGAPEEPEVYNTNISLVEQGKHHFAWNLFIKFLLYNYNSVSRILLLH